MFLYRNKLIVYFFLAYLHDTLKLFTKLYMQYSTKDIITILHIFQMSNTTNLKHIKLVRR